MKIEDLGLSARAYNVLKRARIDTVDQLQQLTDEELLKFRNMGTTTVKEIREKVAYVKTMTIGDKIRSVFATDEGIAETLLSLDISAMENGGRELAMRYCDGKNNCIDGDGNITCNEEMRRACILRWLRKPAEEDRHG